jgi:hypothetical protein
MKSAASIHSITSSGPSKSCIPAGVFAENVVCSPSDVYSISALVSGMVLLPLNSAHPLDYGVSPLLTKFGCVFVKPVNPAGGLGKKQKKDEGEHK